jgi:hypothetical protein
MVLFTVRMCPYKKKIHRTFVFKQLLYLLCAELVLLDSPFLGLWATLFKIAPFLQACEIIYFVCAMMGFKIVQFLIAVI